MNDGSKTKEVYYCLRISIEHISNEVVNGIVFSIID